MYSFHAKPWKHVVNLIKPVNKIHRYSSPLERSFYNRPAKADTKLFSSLEWNNNLEQLQNKTFIENETIKNSVNQENFRENKNREAPEILWRNEPQLSPET